LRIRNRWAKEAEIVPEFVKESVSRNPMIDIERFKPEIERMVDEAIVWQAATNHLPILIREVRERLSA